MQGNFGRWWVGWTGRRPEVVPLDDVREHRLGPGCWCAPRLDGSTRVHNSLDGRERFESGERRPS